MRVLVACEFSGVVREAFRRRGHDAWSNDLLPAEDKSPYHLQGDIRELLGLYGLPREKSRLCRRWDVMIFHWTCTYLTRAGAGWLYNIPRKPKPHILYGEPRRRAMIEHARIFRDLLTCGIPRVCGENPIPYRDARAIMGEPTQKIQPWMFGVPESKGTCLWLVGLPPLRPTNVVELPQEKKKAQRLHWLPPGPSRAQERSRTFPPIADAFAEQWGCL